MTHLADAQPPEDTEKGWKADPLGSGNLRWWDGEQWTENTHSGKGKKKKGPWGELPWAVKAAIVVTGIIVVIVALSSGDDGDDSPELTPANEVSKQKDQQPQATAGGGSSGNQKAASGKVEVKVLGVMKNPSIPNWVGDDTFNDNHTVIGVKVQVKNATSSVKAADFYLQGRGDYEVSSLTAIELDAGEQAREELLFGYLTSELPVVKLKVIEPFDNEVLFAQGLE